MAGNVIVGVEGDEEDIGFLRSKPSSADFLSTVTTAA